MLSQILKVVNQPRRAARWGSTWLKDRLLWNDRYAALREPKRIGEIPHLPEVHEQIADELRRQGFPMVEVDVDLDDYRRFVEQAGYRKIRLYCDGGRSADAAEKMLEHYLAAQFLELSPLDVYLDVASYDSPAPGIYAHLFGCSVYRQDLIYPAGIHGDRIGGDAGKMPVPDGFATRIALHNSFEHFEEDSDIRFIREAGRVLRKGGRMCILPLFLHDRYAIQTDPAVLPRQSLPFEADATLFCVRGWRNRHGRAYDVAHLISRIRDHLGPLELTIGVVRNAREVDPSCYLRFIARFEKP